MVDIEEHKLTFTETMPFRTPEISVIKLHGVIVAAKSPGLAPGHNKINYEAVKPLIDKAFKPKNLKAVLLSINCPGGSPGMVSYLSS